MNLSKHRVMEQALIAGRIVNPQRLCHNPGAAFGATLYRRMSAVLCGTEKPHSVGSIAIFAETLWGFLWVD